MKILKIKWLILIYILILTAVYSNTENDAIKIAYKNDDPIYVELWLQENPSKTIKDFRIPVDKYNITKKAIELGANVNYKGWDGTRPIHEAVFNNYYETSALLIKYGANVNVQSGISAHTNQSEKITPLHHAAKKGNLQLVKLLVENGAKVNAKDYNNQTALYNAVDSENYNVVEFLLKNNSKMNYSTIHRGWSPLNLAVARKNQKITILLIAYGASLKTKGNNQKTILEFAKNYYYPLPQMVKILEKAETPEVQALIKEGKKEEVIKILTETEKSTPSSYV